MVEDPNKNEHVIKLSGKASLPKGLLIGHNYTVEAQGTITSATESDKNDGVHLFYYKFEPVTIEIVNDLGESIRAKDTRSLSQLFRARAWKAWQARGGDMSFEYFYNTLMQHMIQMADEVIELYGPTE